MCGKWELRELGENSEWDKDCLDKESIEFIEKNKQIEFFLSEASP